MSSATAVSALKSLPLFRNTSLRLLADLVALAQNEPIEADKPICAPTALLAVIDGVVGIDVEGSNLGRMNAGRGTAFVADEATLADRTVRMSTAGSARVRRLDKEGMADRVEASPALLRSLDAGLVEVLVPKVDAHPRLHLVWMAAEPNFDVPLEALTFLLAAAIAQQFGEPAAVAVLHGDRADLYVWGDDGFIRHDARLPAGVVDEDALIHRLDVEGVDFMHLLVVHPRDPRALPRRFALHFHRVVEVARRPATSVPEALLALLRPQVFAPHHPSEPHLSAFVSTVLLPAAPGPRRAELRTEPVALDDADEDHLPSRPGWRLRRDLCRLRLDAGMVARRQRSHRGSTAEFAVALLADREGGAVRASALRWARAVTNRRVGIALSGGGASTYRMVPLLRALHEGGVPIDVVSGISGGALLGAYYAHGGLAGLEQCTARGLVFQMAVAVSAIDSTLFGWLIDRDLHGTTLDDLEVTFVPMTTALRADRPPEPHVVVGGSLGEAVRVSGSLPVLFAPREAHGTRFADGALSTPVPARVLRDFGADMVIACNCVPGAKQRNPFSAWPLGELTYSRTPIGRLVDLWVSSAGLLQRVSREATDDAHVFIEAEDTGVPLVESFRFYDAARIATETDKVAEHVRIAQLRWMGFSGQNLDFAWGKQ